MNNLVSEHTGPDKRSFALPSLAEDEVVDGSHPDTDTSFFTHDVSHVTSSFSDWSINRLLPLVHLAIFVKISMGNSTLIYVSTTACSLLLQR